MLPSDQYEIQSLQLSTFLRSAGTLNNPSWVISAIDNIKAVKVKNCLMPLAVYVIDSRNCNVYFVEQATNTITRTCVLSFGNYTGSTLATELSSKITAAGTGLYSVAYASVSNTLTISNMANFKIVSGNNNANYEIGFENSTGIYNTSIIGANQVDLSGVKTIHLVSNIGGIVVVGKNFNILASINVEEVVSTVSLHTDDSSDYINFQTQSLSEISLILYDERFRPINPSKDFSLNINFLTD